MKPKPMLILITGPHTSGTNGDVEKIATNMRALENASHPIFEKGHIPVLVEWIAPPIGRASGLGAADGAPYIDMIYTLAARVLDRVDAVLRLPGASSGADNDVKIAKEKGIPIYLNTEDVPALATMV